MNNKACSVQIHFVMLSLILLLLLAPHGACAGTLFVCVDKSGHETITDIELDQQTCRTVGTFPDRTPQQKIDEEKKREEQDRQTDEEFRKKGINEENAKKLADCLNEAQKRFDETWGNSCRLLDLPWQCNLTEETASKLKEIFEEEKNQCKAKFSPVE
jgi:hypothetical protein